MEPPETQDPFPRLTIPSDLRARVLEAARGFRKSPTKSEAELWQVLRRKGLEGIKFRRQQPIGPFVVDFYAPAHRLVVEVDGPIHAQQVEADCARQELLEALGLRVLRIPAALVEQDVQAAVALIRAAILDER